MSRNSRSIPQVNAGSMADIAFLLLIFFLVTTTMDVDTGIFTKLPPMPEDVPPDDSQIKKKNVLVVLVNSNDQLLVNDQWIDIKNLKDKTIEFLNNNGRNPNLSDNPQKAVISLQNDRGTSYEMYVKVQNELRRAYNKLRDEEAMNQYARKYDKLSVAQQKIIRGIYPQKISEAEPVDIGGIRK